MLEYEKIGRRFKINGFYYNFRREYTTKNKYYLCNKNRCTIRCRGSITISPDSKIFKMVKHNCNTLKTENLPQITEYEQIGGKTKINGYYHYFRYESINKNKNYSCIIWKPRRCHGSITITPNSQIVKQIRHTCGKASPIISQERPDPLATEDNHI